MSTPLSFRPHTVHRKYKSGLCIIVCILHSTVSLNRQDKMSLELSSFCNDLPRWPAKIFAFFTNSANISYLMKWSWLHRSHFQFPIDLLFIRQRSCYRWHPVVCFIRLALPWLQLKPFCHHVLYGLLYKRRATWSVVAPLSSHCQWLQAKGQ